MCSKHSGNKTGIVILCEGKDSVIFVLIYFLVSVFKLFFSFSFVLVLQYFLVLVLPVILLVLVSFQFCQTC